LAILGGTTFSTFDPSTHIGSPAFFPLSQVLCRVGRYPLPEKQEWAIQLIGETLAKLVLSSAMLLQFQGTPPPEPPSFAYAKETIPNESGENAKLFIWAANRIAMLASPGFDSALESLQFRIGVGEARVDPENTVADLDLEIFLQRAAVLSGHAVFVGLSVKTIAEAEAFQTELQNVKALGIEAANAAQAYVKKERSLLVSQ
jgi:hypothetical protein